MEVSACLLDHQGADDDVEIKIAIGADIADRPGIGTTPHRLQFVQDLHAAKLRDPGDGAAGEDRLNEIHAVAPGCQATSNVRHNMNDVRIALQGHEVIDMNTA